MADAEQGKSDKSAIRFVEVEKKFTVKEGSLPVLRGVSGEVPAGALLTLLGPSGSGKSTLLSLCNLMLTPDRGKVFVEGKEIRDWDIPALRRRVGMVFQTPTMLPGTVLDNLQLSANLRGETLEQPEQFLQSVGLSADYLSRHAQDLSGGQKQRVALARTLVNHPSILLLDEVTSALEPATVREIEELIKSIQAKHGTTILWVTHNLEQAHRIGDLAWLMIDGQLVEQGRAESFFNRPQHDLTRRFLQGELMEGGLQ